MRTIDSFRHQCMSDAEERLECPHCKKLYNRLVCKLIKINVHIPSVDEVLKMAQSMASIEYSGPSVSLSKEEDEILMSAVGGLSQILMLSICKERM